MTTPRRVDRAQDLIRQPLAGDIPLARDLAAMTQEGSLYRPLENDAVQCFACGHECTIKAGGRGICQVRYNLGGKLYVPHGYVAALQCDPTEKKPFYHLYPGSDTLTFGMLGCDIHCPYCFTGDTRVVTNRGVLRFEDLFYTADTIVPQADGAEIAYSQHLKAVAASGAWRQVKGIFKLPYFGEMVIIRPYGLPELHCTTDHNLYATKDPLQAPQLIQAQDLTLEHYLVIPREYSFLEAEALLEPNPDDSNYLPQDLMQYSQATLQRFLTAYLFEHGTYSDNGKVSVKVTTEAAAHNLFCLVLRLGNLPTLYESNRLYTLSWYRNNAVKRAYLETDDYYLVPLRNLEVIDFAGEVYNMEVEEEHNYLAGFLLVKNCQNWDISQALRDVNAGRPPNRVTAQELVQLGVRNGAKNIASSYNEPLITAEWAVEVFQAAQQAGLTCAFVSNGNATKEVLEYIRPFTRAYKIDLKTMNPKNYRQLGAVLEHILEGIRMVHEMGFWLEIVTLVIPGFNSSEDELRAAARFIKSLSPDIPWHVTGFHKDYKMQEPPYTDAQLLRRAAEIGQEEGLHYVYAGNRPGQVGDFEHTFCPSCHKRLIERLGYVILDYQITAAGTCPQCQTKIAGIFTAKPQEVRTGTAADLYYRRPRPVR